jgi:carbamoyl-phosphate synthase large subunit
MEHIEEAGIHSGDSACSLPPHNLKPATIEALDRQTRELALALRVGGLMNVQYAIKDGDIYVLEVNPRASRTVPFVAKVVGLPVAKIAARIMAGESLASFKLAPGRFAPGSATHIGVKEAVFPFARFGEKVDTVLGPEMKSTGEVMGIDRSFDIAFVKSQLGGGARLPHRGTVFVSVRDVDKERVLEAVRTLTSIGFKVIATSGTQRFLAERGVTAERILKASEGRPNVVDAIKNGGVQLVFNTTEGAQALNDSKPLRRAALLHKVPYYTTLSGAVAAAQGIKAYLGGDLEVRALQSYFGGKVASG